MPHNIGGKDASQSAAGGDQAGHCSDKHTGIKVHNERAECHLPCQLSQDDDGRE